MPFKSKAQRRFFYAAEARGELPKGTAARWEEETPKGKKLPERKKTAAWEQGVQDAMNKIAALSPAEMLIAKHMLAGAGIGAVYGGLDRYDHSGKKPGESDARFKNRRVRQSLAAAVKGAGKGAGVGMITGSIHSGRAKELMEQMFRQRMGG